MKNIKLRIVYLILGAALLLFALFMLAVNVVIPAHFVSEAEKALRNEAQYENRTIPYTYEGEVYDDDWDDGAEEHFFTPSIVFLELENGYQPNTELRLLSYMLKQPEKAYSREELLNAVWGFDSEVETRVTDETLRRIRKKLLQVGSTVSVSTIWGFGYKLKGAERT